MNYDPEMKEPPKKKKSGSLGCLLFLIIIIGIASLPHIIKDFNKIWPFGKTTNTVTNTVTNTADKGKTSNVVNNIDNTPKEEHYHSYYDGSLGSCGDLRGNIVIVSIFANDKETKWSTSGSTDQNKMLKTFQNLKIATEYIKTNAAKYGSTVNFYFDWMGDSLLKYNTSFNGQSMINAGGSNYYPQLTWITQNIDSQKIIDKYKADHILYFFFYDSAKDNKQRSYIYKNAPGQEYVMTEFVDLFVRLNNDYLPPAAYAHEILHAFGAPDMYYANETIPQAYVDYLKQKKSSEIMYTVYLGDEITNKFTSLDAYYVGIGPEPSSVSKWGLGKSEHVK